MSRLGKFALACCRAWSHVAPIQRGGYRLTRLARSLIPRRQWSGDFQTPDGVRLRLDLATYPDCCMATGLYELDTLRLLKRLLRSGDHFVDLGANIGYFTLHASCVVGADGRVDGFEPDPINRARLAEHLRLNGAPRQVNVHARAVSDHAGAATLYHPTTPGRNHGEASLFPPVGAALEKFTVPTERLDQAIDHSPRLIKMDIEGAELEAIKGMTGLLQNDAPPLLVIEHNPETCTTAGYAPGDLLRELRRANPHYQAHWIGWRLKPLDSADIIDAITLQGNILYQAGRQASPTRHRKKRGSPPTKPPCSKNLW